MLEGELRWAGNVFIIGIKEGDPKKISLDRNC
jgi:hypothetical protein